LERRELYGTQNIRRRKKSRLSPKTSSVMELSQEEKLANQRKQMESLRHNTYHLRPASSPASSAWLQRKKSQDELNRKIQTTKKKQELRTTKLLKEAKNDRLEESKEQFRLWLQWKKMSNKTPMRFTVFKKMQYVDAAKDFDTIKAKESSSKKSILKSENQINTKVAQEVTFSTAKLVEAIGEIRKPDKMYETLYRTPIA